MNRICELLGVQYPIVSGGMVWCSGYKLACAVSNAGGLGLIGAGSMHPDTLQEHIRKAKEHTEKPFGVNVPLMYPQMDEIMAIIREEHVPVVFTSAGSPKTWTKTLQGDGIKVVHVVSSTKFALKSQEAGVDAVVAEGFEAGGHNGREETSTMCLIPPVTEAVEIPVLAAGGIASGRAMAAAFALGAEGVQVGTAFALTQESSAHDNFKQHCLSLGEGDTKLLLKQLAPTRMAKGNFLDVVQAAEHKGAEPDALKVILGRGRSKLGIFEGDLEEGQLEIGQVAAQIDELLPAATVLHNIVDEFNTTMQKIQGMSF